MPFLEIPKYASFYVWSKCKKHIWTYIIVGLLMVIMATLITLSIPRKYASQVTLADEHKELGLLVGLNNSTAWIVQNEANLTEDQGINDPEVYGIILESRDFCKALMQITLDKYNITLGEYLKAIRVSWWKRIEYWLDYLFQKEQPIEEYILDHIQNSLKYSYSYRKGTIIVQYEDQDPEVCYNVVTSAVSLLQSNILKKRNSFYQAQIEGARENRKYARAMYQEALQNYTRYADAHQGNSLMSEQKVIDALEKERDIAFDEYKKVCLQLKRKEFIAMQKAFSFTVLKQASVPLSPIAPSLPTYIIIFLIIGFVFTTWYILYLK